MTAVVLYTDTDAIRSAIGVDDADISDILITSQFMQDQMLVELDVISPTHASDIFLGGAKERNLRLWCTWFGALRLAESPLATPKRISTGKDELDRFVIDWEALTKLARSKMAELEEIIAPSSVAELTFMGKATPGSDPITNT